MIRIVTCLLLFLIIPCTGFGRYRVLDRILPDLDKLSIIISQGSDEEKIKSLGRFYPLSANSNGEYWKRQENWAPLLQLLADDSPLVRVETLRFCFRLSRNSRRGNSNLFLHPDSNPVVHTRLIPALRRTLQDVDPEVRKEACKAIKKYKDLKAIPLLERLLDDPNPWIQFEAIVALTQLVPYSSVSVFNHLLELLGMNKPWPYVLIQREALHCIKKLRLPTESRAPFFIVMQKSLSNPYLTKEIVHLLFAKFDSLTPENRGYVFSLLQRTDKRIPLLVLQNLQRRSPPPAMFVASQDPAKQMTCNPKNFSELKDENGADYDLLKLLTPLLSSVHQEIREAATNLIRRIENTEVIEPLVSLADDDDPKVREKAIRGLLHGSDPRIPVLLRIRVNDPDDKVRQTAIMVAVTRMENEDSGEHKMFLLKKLHDPYPPTRLYIARQLLKIKAPELLEKIIPYLSDKGMDKIFEELIGGTAIDKVYILRGIDGSRIVGTDREQVPVGTPHSVKFIHTPAVEHLFNYLATCRGDCLIWQRQLVKFEHEGIEPYLLKLANSSVASERIFAIQRLGTYGTIKALPKLKSLLDSLDDRMVETVYQTIGRLHYPELALIIINTLQGRDKLTREYAVKASSAFTMVSAEMIDALIPLLADPDHQIRASTLTALHRLHYSRFVEIAIQMLQDPSEEVQMSALIGLRVTLPSSGALDLLLGLIDDYETQNGYHENAIIAVQVIGKIGDSAAVKPLLGLIERSGSKRMKPIGYGDVDVTRSSIEALAEIGSPQAVVALTRFLDSASRGRDAYRVLGQNFTWAEVQEILKGEADGEQLRITYEQQFPEKEEFVLRLDKLIKGYQITATELDSKREQWPAISSRYVLEKRIKAGTLRMNQGLELKNLLLALLDDKNKNVVRNSASDLAQMKDSSTLTLIENAILTECNGTTISPIIKDLIHSLDKLGGRDVIPFLVRGLDCPAPLASFYIEGALRENFTSEEIYTVLEGDQDREQLVKTYNFHFLPDFKGDKLRGKGLQPPTDLTKSGTVSLSRPSLKIDAGFQSPRSRRLGNSASFQLPHDQLAAGMSVSYFKTLYRLTGVK